jgi:hypothetical protein
MRFEQQNNIPLGLKPRFYAAFWARLKAMPFQCLVYATSSKGKKLG